jgi:hypothetical protein
MFPDPAILLLVADLSALTEWRLWKRLLDSESLSLPTLTAVPAAEGSNIRRELPLLMPPGDFKSVHFVDPAMEIPSGRTRAMILAQGRVAVAMTGPPTEDAWELFIDLARSVTS